MFHLVQSCRRLLHEGIRFRLRPILVLSAIGLVGSAITALQLIAVEGLEWFPGRQILQRGVNAFLPGVSPCSAGPGANELLDNGRRKRT